MAIGHGQEGAGHGQGEDEMMEEGFWRKVLQGPCLDVHPRGLDPLHLPSQALEPWLEQLKCSAALEEGRPGPAQWALQRAEEETNPREHSMSHSEGNPTSGPEPKTRSRNPERDFAAFSRDFYQKDQSSNNDRK